ncbi:hypothetical protein [Treponema zioleckii]|uniref:hypothetical protein n=1 Tax=Treponema zioleckii TaxID=331680 RepID=UPI00168B7E7F|nr:hypothetical protein [Treponema zioleckii]
MKKVALALAGLALGTSVFAEGFKLSGDVKGGWSLTQNEIKNGDTEAKTAGVHVNKYLVGDEFDTDARARLNFSWASEGDVAGAFVRLQDTPNYDQVDVKLAYAWLKGFDGKFQMQAGKLDTLFGTGGYNDSDVHGGLGFFAGVSPIEGLLIGGGAQTDWLKTKDTKTTKVPTYDEDTDSVTTKDTTTGGKLAASKDGIYFGAKYTNKDINNLSVAASYSLAGFLSAGVCVDPVEKLFVSVELENKSADYIKANGDTDILGAKGDFRNTIYERIEYTGVENLSVGLNAKQQLKAQANGSDDDADLTVIYLDPFARYEINDLFAVSLEAQITINSWDEDKYGKTDAAQVIVPAFYLKPAKGAEATVWAAISTHTDTKDSWSKQHQFGTGVKFGF